MTRPLILFPDPVASALAVLRGAFAADPAVSEANPSVSQSMPSRDVYTVRPAILVADDGDAGTGSRVHEAATVRVTVWDTDAHRGMTLARLARAYLTAHPGPGSFRGGTRPFASTDPDDETPLASFTITARHKGEVRSTP